ncbi:Rieske 2Fe-2S domain-containing protein [Thalassoroseus pseudoceratinae]|uniref:Rieske 2Fe-2S domain-containing protein n=1 Tax=Thalassoroseus pseudoceratinae TaxID=2713176 RepID=UPI001422214D|nr:Rieske 2Fe-2S domain-containing protein [Thalassoroseus pseudoceratinae]
MGNPVETWKAEKHPFEVWSDVEQYAADRTPMQKIETPNLERMKWHGFFYRKRDTPGRYMNRIRVTAGELTADQAREIAYMAYEYGHGIVDVTTRANVQIQGLDIEHLPEVAQRLTNVGLTSKQTGHDNIRNVFAHPFSGLLPDELIDTRELCHDVTALFVDSREYSDLPRKMNICLNGTDNHSSHFWTQDISFLATEVNERILFQVLLAGTQGQNPRLAWHLPVLVEPSQVVEVTRSLLDLFRAKGSRGKRNKARMRFLLEEIGIGGVLEWLEQDLSFRLIPSVAEPVPGSNRDELVGWFRQSDPKLWTMGISIPLGRMTSQQLEGLALLSKRWGSGQLRTTHEQGIAVIDIPTNFKDAAATEAAGLGLSVHADEFEQNTIACTGNQFCNIAVTETKGHMFQLIEKLRKRMLKLHGIRIHMSGCPSSCAQHFTADIGLKGVRVRRILGTREGFDVFLGGGLAGQVHLGLPYKLGVDVDQLPQLIEDVVKEYYLKHRAGQTFSAYWRERLQAAEAEKVDDNDYQVSTWICESCDYRHQGEDPPVFCPSCSGLRRYFARLEEAEEKSIDAPEENATIERNDGFQFAAKLDQLVEGSGFSVEVQGKDLALFLIDGKVHCIDAACPHEGASLADGEVRGKVVACPWHDWEFDVCSGCSLDPPNNDVESYETLIEDQQVFVKIQSANPIQNGKTTDDGGKRKMMNPMLASLTLREIIQETPDVKTFRFDNSAGEIPFDYPGKFAKVCVPTDDGDVWRSFTISSSPTQKDVLDLTIKLNPLGVVSRHLFEMAQLGHQIQLKGAQGGYFFDPMSHTEPLLLVSAGSGVTPMMSIVRYIRATGIKRPVKFLYGARTETDIIFRDECEQLAQEHDWFDYRVCLSQPGDEWTGNRGRIDAKSFQEWFPELASYRCFLCGPEDFMQQLQSSLIAADVPQDRIHTELFHRSSTPAKIGT